MCKLCNVSFQLERNPSIRVNEPAEKPNDYDYYDTQPSRRYMQSMRRNWNSNNRGTRSEDAYGSKRCRSFKSFVEQFLQRFITAPSSYESLLHDMEKGTDGKKHDAISQTVKKVNNLTEFWKF